MTADCQPHQAPPSTLLRTGVSTLVVGVARVFGAGGRARLSRRLLLGILALGWPLAVARSQEPDVPPGSRVRVTFAPPTARVLVGVYQGWQDSILRLAFASGPVVVPRSGILRLELSQGHRPSVAGGIAGALLGAGAGGFAVGCLANRDSYGVLCAGQDDTKVVLGAALGGVIGAAVGATLFRRERWVAVRLGSPSLPDSPR